jgi:hypothetical protein
MGDMVTFSDKPFNPEDAPVVGPSNMPLTQRYRSKYEDLIDARGRVGLGLYEPSKDPLHRPMGLTKSKPDAPPVSALLQTTPGGKLAVQDTAVATGSQSTTEQPYDLFVEPNEDDNWAVTTTTLARVGHIPKEFLDSVPPIKQAALDGHGSVVSVLSMASGKRDGWEPSDDMVVVPGYAPPNALKKPQQQQKVAVTVSHSSTQSSSRPHPSTALYPLKT